VELGARHIIFQLPDPDRARATDRFARMCDLASARNLFVTLEFPHWTETGTLDEAARVVRAVQKSNAGILVDMLHMARSNSSIGHLAALPREWFPFVHVCDADARCPSTVPEMIRTARDERDFPGEGTIDIQAILGAMPKNLPYSLEIPRATLTKAVGPYEVARLALLASRAHLDGESWHANPGVSAQAQSRDIRTVNPQGRA
jgi:sugar phosphate isomerase/epimerase